jgi:hypothetical protein
MTAFILDADTAADILLNEDDLRDVLPAPTEEAVATPSAP